MAGERDNWLVVMLTWPCGMVFPESLLWFARHGIPIDADHIRSVQVSPHEEAVKLSIKAALDSPFDSFVFAELDLRLSALADEFWLSEADVVCVQYGGRKGWATSGLFHMGMWRTARAVLERVDLERIVWPERGCLCRPLQAEFRRLGLSLRSAGWADHVHCRFREREKNRKLKTEIN